jgi:hypothetical protein
MQPSKYSNKNFQTELQEKPKITSKVLKKPAVLRPEATGLVRPEATGLCT